jgi:hypothetical protein
MAKDAVKRELEKLHVELTKQLLARVKNGSATAADLSVARQFLKDNNIDAVPEEGSPLADLARGVPFQDTDEADFKH